MWIFTPSGFVSAVYKEGAMQVRARDKQSLASLEAKTGSPVKHTTLADYPYRLSTSHSDFANWAFEQALAIDYSNFKSEVADVRGYGFAKTLNKIWSVMHEVEDEGARVR
jgi:UDP-3-O-acyl-N-acetylglucosamine deacetylase